MRIYITTAAALLLMAVCSCDKQEGLPYWRDVNVTSVNAETRRTEVIFYPSEYEALEGGFRDSRFYLDLDGRWDFRYFDDHREMEKFFDKALSGKGKPGWDSINVPGNWEVQGFGTAIYVNIPYEFCPKDPAPPALPEAVPAGVYHRRFTVPSGWEGRRIFLNLAGVKGGTYVYVNGKEVGYGEDSKSLARYDVSDFLKKGENELLVKVYRYSTGSYLECQDFWRISGFERDVYLSTEKEKTGFDFSVVSTVDESLTEGDFRLSVRGDVASFSYRLLEKTAGGYRAVASGEGPVEGERLFEARIENPRLWSAEDPYLYTLLMEVNGEYTAFHTGFRRLEITSIPFRDTTVTVFLVNGQPVKFKGVNLHEHNEFTGHYVDRELILKDLRLMKEANINAIRTCHYPQPREFYELCDSLGFYVYDEANIESHGMGYRPERTLGNNTEWYGKHLDRTLNMYYRTANYPCVTILSLGNEAGNGENFYNTYKVLKELEKDGQNRPVCYERAERDWNTDMLVPQYPGADWFHAMGEKERERPVCPSEYAHAMGNSTGSLDFQWNEINSYPHLQGGFIWDWVDQGLAETDSLGRKWWAYGGDYGENSPADGNFNCNGIVNPDRNPHPAYVEVRHAYQNVSVVPENIAGGVFKVINRYYFSSLEPFTLRYEIRQDGEAVRSGDIALSAPAGGSETIRISYPSFLPRSRYDIVFKTVNRVAMPLLKPRTLLALDQYVLKEAVPGSSSMERRMPVDVYEDGDSISLGADGFTLVYDKRKGYITSLVTGGVERIDASFGIRPLFWRGPVDNDYGNGLPSRCQMWKEASRQFEAEASVTGDDRETVLSVRYSLPGGTSLTMDCEVLQPGILKIHSLFKGADGEAVDIPRIGYRMRLPAAKGDEFMYSGRGPSENYQDRNSGSIKGIYYSTAKEEYYPYVRPQECGHHTDTDLLIYFPTGLSVSADSPFEFNLLRQYVEDLDSEETLSKDYQWYNHDPAEEHDPARARNILRRRTHINDVPVRDDAELCIDYKMSGVGGYDSWGSRPEPSRTLWSDKDYEWTIYLR